MKAPRRVGAPIDGVRVRRWVTEFAGYRVHVSEGRIDRWLQQFRGPHRDLAARVLDVVEFISHEQIADAYRAALRRLPGWHIEPKQRSGKWRFVPFSVSAGESGDSMLHAFRLANSLDKKKFDSLFVGKRDLPGEKLGPEDSVVFVDDFSGTGTQATTAWKETLQDLLPGQPSVYLVLVAASAAARNRIREETPLTVVPHNVLSERDNIFHASCGHFSREDKSTMREYCRTADHANPEGYGGCGFVVVFSHNCPNNSIPVLHASNDRWEGLFRRHD